MDVMRFRAYLLPEGPTAPGELLATTDCDFLILPADRMRAERMSTQVLPPSQRGPGAVKAHPESWVLLWLYCAAQRTGWTDGDSFDAWADRVAEYDRLDAHGQVVKRGTDPELVEQAAVDPTQPVASTT
jgi:hypothetical protein